MHRALALVLVLSAGVAAPAVAGDDLPFAGGEPAKVMMVGTFHFANPGMDAFNVQVDDVLAEKRQAEIARILDGLACFEPTAVMVEMPAAVADERYPKFREGTLSPSPNESVQLGFRLAAMRGLDAVHGIDVPGEFPFGPVQAYAEANGMGERLGAWMAWMGQHIGQTSEQLKTDSLGAILRRWNAPGQAMRGHALYVDMLRFGRGDAQPGVDLAAAWYTRNLAICARMLQALEPGARAVVIYGDGHSHLLRQCAIEAPGVELVESFDYLPAE